MDEKWLELWKETLDDLRAAEPRDVDLILRHSIAHLLNTIKGYTELYKKTYNDSEPMLDAETLVDIVVTNVDAIHTLLEAFIEEPTEAISIESGQSENRPCEILVAFLNIKRCR